MVSNRQLFALSLCTAAIVSLLLIAPGPAQAQVPPGFEALLEKQRTLLDVYFANEFLVSAPAEYNIDEVELDNPAEVLQRIPGVTDRDRVLEALTGALAANAQLRCYTRGQLNCGALEPEVAGIIFDEDRFRVDIFINPQYLVVQNIPIGSFLPASDTGWSFLQNFGNVVAGSDDDAFETYSLNAASMFAHRETRFLMTTSYSNISDWTADDILVRRDFQGREHQLGYFRTVNDASLRFIPEISLRGIRTASTLDTRTDLDSSTGRELSIFLVNRSRVSLFKDGRLVSSRNYDAGNQIIDTARLPNGAYPIIIRIEDASGRSRDEQRFYVKSNRFPPRDQALWGLELGEQVRRNSEDFIPENENVFFGRFSMSRRITDSLALNTGVAALDEDGILEVGIDRLDPYYDLQLSGAVGSEGGYGLSIDAGTRWRGVNLRGNYRETWADNDLDADGDDDDELRALAAGASFFLEDSRQFSSRLTWYLAGGTFAFDIRNTQISGQQNIEEYSASYSYPIIRYGTYRLDLDTEVSEFNDSRQFLMSLRFRWDKGRFTNTAASQYQYRDADSAGSDSDLEFEAGTNWYNSAAGAGDLNLNGRVSHRADFDDATGGLRWRSRFGEVESDVRHERRDDASQTSYAASYYSSFAWSDGGIAVGGYEQSRSGILIDLVGADIDDAYFDIMVNGSLRGTARIGTRNLITVQPFDTYEVDIIPRGQSFVSFDARTETVTLYPGNVAALSWDVSAVNVVFGRLLDQSGAPFSNAVLRGAAGLAMSDDNGFFQAELKASVQSLQVESRSHRCELPLPAYEPVNGIAVLGTLSCEAVPKSP